MAVKGFLFNIQKFSLHDGPGIRTVLFFTGCPLACRWCSNPQKAAFADSRHYSINELMAVIMQDRPFYEESGGGVTLSGGEPLLQTEYSCTLLHELKKEKIHNAIETSGFASHEDFNKISALTDLLLFDIKHYDKEKLIAGTGVSLDSILSNLKNSLNLCAEILPRIAVIPGYNDSIIDAHGFVELLAQFGMKRLQLLPFHQFGEKKYEISNIPYAMKGVPQLHPEDLEEYRKVFLENGIDCFF